MVKRHRRVGGGQRSRGEKVSKVCDQEGRIPSL